MILKGVSTPVVTVIPNVTVSDYISKKLVFQPGVWRWINEPSLPMQVSSEIYHSCINSEDGDQDLPTRNL